MTRHRRRAVFSTAAGVLTFALLACTTEADRVAEAQQAARSTIVDAEPGAAPEAASEVGGRQVEGAPVRPLPDLTRYPWASTLDPATLPPLTTLEGRFEPPKGYTRVATGDYGEWLRGLPIRLDRITVYAHDGSPLKSPSQAVVLLDVGKRNLQQCADTALRLHAEYRWQRGEAGRVAYHFTSGDLSSWKAWRRGERFKIVGNKVKRVQGRGSANTHAAYRGYLEHLFRYAGTMSLRLDSDPVKIGQAIEAGDFFVTPGSPGHAVIVLDVAENDEGERVALIGQGFMPAQDLHVVADRGEHVLDRVWFKLPVKASDVLDTPSWSPFPRRSARRFKNR